MKLSTWNLRSSNNHQEKSINFLLSLRIDIMCLQELTEQSIEYLMGMQEYSVSYTPDYYHKKKVFFNAIVSRLNPLISDTISLKTKIRPSILTRLFKKKRGVSFLCNDYALDNHHSIRIFNTHLNLDMGPRQRLAQLNEICSHFITGDKTHNVICGDLNSFARIPLNFFIGPLFKFALKDYKTNELKFLASSIKKYNLKLGLKKTTTFPLLHLHLDHILIPEYWHNYQTRVYRRKKGSDHRLIVLDAQL